VDQDALTTLLTAAGAAAPASSRFMPMLIMA
jgi:hypothetical protein